MKRFHFSLFATSISSLLMSNLALAAAFQFYELGTPVIGTAAVGQAVVNDASAAYFNPASMMQIQRSQYLLGSQLILPYTNFSKSSRTTISGDNGGNASTLIPGLDMYLAYCLCPKLKLGLSLTSPYGGLLNYNDGWAGRYLVQDLQLLTLNLSPSVAYQINNWISVGAGVAAEYASLYETVALPIITTPVVDGQANIKVSNVAYGYNFGVLLSPTCSTKVGIAYRSKITHDFSGNTTFYRIGAQPHTTTRMVLPQAIILSLQQAINNQFNLLGELGWAEWSTMKNTVVNIQNFSATTILNWHNTYRIGLGAQYHCNPALLLQSGASYDSSPTSSSRRVPDLPMDRQIRIGAGVIYSVIPPVHLGFSYEYINFGHANINNVSSNGLLSGSYARNYANVIQASISVDV